MLFSKILPALLAAATVSAVPILDKRQGQKTRGVNIGGWLVLEPWITPSIFQAYPAGNIVDEWTLAQYDPANAANVLQNHWKTWVTLADFQRIVAANKGINMVRIPVGYWAFQKYGGDTYIQGAADYLDQAIGWAGQVGLKVWVDLHGAPKSQNGFDNSGQRTASPQWTSGDTIGFTAGVINQITQRYGNNPTVIGIELLNEPLMGSLPGNRPAVESYYNQGHDTVRGQSAVPVVIHDGFATPSSWNGIVPDSIVDHHEYQVFSNGDVALSYQAHVDAVYSRAATWAAGHDRGLVCGEWTAAMTDCAPALNGYGIGARYDGTYSTSAGASSTYVGSCGNKNFIDEWDQDLKTATTNYIQAQINAFESNTDGWIFWNFKTEASAEWDFFRLVDNKIWP